MRLPDTRGNLFTAPRPGSAGGLSHHERWDGRGYPRGLEGSEIPLEGRIAAITDVFDALTTDRIYRPAFHLANAIDMMKEERGRHFDPDLLDVFFSELPAVLDIRAQFE